jgi:hypothetical protein
MNDGAPEVVGLTRRCLAIGEIGKGVRFFETAQAVRSAPAVDAMTGNAGRTKNFLTAF